MSPLQSAHTHTEQMRARSKKKLPAKRKPGQLALKEVTNLPPVRDDEPVGMRHESCLSPVSEISKQLPYCNYSQQRSLFQQQFKTLEADDGALRMRSFV